MFAGCFWAPDPITWRHVYEIGGAQDITEWTLRQRDPHEVENGVLALGDIASEQYGADPEERVAALRGLATVSEAKGTGIYRSNNYWRIASILSEDPTLPLSYSDVEPPVESTELHRAWEHAGINCGLLAPKSAAESEVEDP